MKVTGNIEKMLVEAQKNTCERRLTLNEVKAAVGDLVEYLHGKGIAYNALVGTEATLNPLSQHFPNAYRGIPMSTQLSVEFTCSTCKVTRIYRGTATTRKIRIVLSPGAKVSLVNAVEVGA